MSSWATEKVTRREFARTTGAALCTGSLMTAHAVNGNDALSAAVAGDYIDFHVHLTQRWFGKKSGPVTAQHLIRWMDNHGISRAVVLPLVSPEAFWYPVTTEFVLRETSVFPDRLIPFCAIDPRALSTHLTDRQQVVDMLRRYRDAGARGFGEHKAKMPIDDPLNMKLYEACAEIQLPVLFHLDNYANMDQPGLPGLAKVLEALPDLVMIGHGKGWWASISGGLAQADLQVGYPRGPVRAGGAIDRLMDKFPNLYGDLSSSGAHAMTRDPRFGVKFLQRRSDRLLFGTDYYDLTQKTFPHFDLLGEFDLSPGDSEKIARGNAIRLLRLC
ncbi:amidohydrolase family protein [Pirellulales bacterium]|nr:amidohydrolase family protein [Pirellulales bacterium]